MPRWVYLLLAVGVLVGAACGTARQQADDLGHSIPRGWSSLAAPPFARWSAVALWTGRELFYWGGDTGSDRTHHNHGALYDPAADRWRRVPSAPLDGRSQAGAVWTGKEVFVWGGLASGGARNDGALFDPVGGKWRLLPPAPLSPRIPVAVVWTGAEAIVWGDTSRSPRPEQREGAAYDPEADRWRKLLKAPLGFNLAQAVWAGKEMIVFGALLDGRNYSSTPHAQGIAYEPEADSWRVIRDHPLSPQAFQRRLDRKGGPRLGLRARRGRLRPGGGLVAKGRPSTASLLRVLPRERTVARSRRRVVLWARSDLRHRHERLATNPRTSG